MNSAPAELLQLLTIAALQPSSSDYARHIDRFAVSHRSPHQSRKEKAAMPEQDQAVRLVFFVKLTCILSESASYFRSVYLNVRVLKIATFTF